MKFRLLLFFFFIIHVIFGQSEFNTPEKITLYWDTSLSMEAKDIAKEFELLDNYFTNLQNVEVELVKFSNIIDEETQHIVTNGDWSSLKSSLANTNYDGTAFFEIIFKSKTSDVNLLFTDGITVLDKLQVGTKRPTFIINSCERANHRLLRKQGIRSQGNYINLNEVTIEQSMSLLKVSLKNTPIDTKGDSNIKNLLQDNLITGTVYGPNGALKDASVTINNNSFGLVTDRNGKYKIKAKDGDELMVSHVGMQTQIITIKKPYIIDVHLLNRENTLDEVVVKGKGDIVEEVEDTAYGKADKRKLGYAVQSIDDNDISPVISDISNATQGKFSIANNGSNGDISRMIIRGFISLSFNSFPLIVIDNIPTIRVTNTTAASENFLRSLVDPNNVAKITILKGLAATNSWGSEGKGGVILITTKTASFEKKTPNPGFAKRNNVYNESLTLVNTAINAPYIEELRKFESLKEVYSTYLGQRKEYNEDMTYFINVSDYIAQLGNKELSSKILSNLIENNRNDVGLLKLVAFKAEKKYDYLLAKKVYERITELRPKNAQSYRDLALIYQETGHYQKALDIYNNIDNNRIKGVDFSGLRKNIDSEFRRLVSLYKKELSSAEIPEKYLNKVNYDARIVFDWNDRNAEFELQFVNPQKLFFTWSHTTSKNESRMTAEKIQGFNSEEFLLIDAPIGEWLININNKTRKSVKKPILIKYTVYHNYGKPNESKELKTVLLNNIKGKQMIAKVVIK